MLELFSEPKGIAVVGASRTAGKMGHDVLRNIVDHGYSGAVYPINPHASEILGLVCYPSVLLTPGPVDLAVVVVPSRLVAQALIECGEKGVRGAIILSSGFREMGSEGWQREREIVSIARRYGMRLIGPNCLGVIDLVSGLNASFARGMPRYGSIAFLSQSGALCTAVLDMALADQVGFSRFVSLGNKADVDEITFIDAWEKDPHTSVIMAYLEGIEDGVGFVEVARRVSRQKPIIVIKSGTTNAGSRAVSSHTGTLSGSERAYQTAFRQSGVIRADSVQDLFDYSIAFARQPLLPNDRIAIVTNAGGPGIMATDACERAGLQLASLEPKTIQALRRVLPESASTLNPVDVLGDGLAEQYGQALELVLEDPNVGGVVVILTPQAMTQIEETARVVGEHAQRTDKPVLGCFMGRQTVEPGIAVLNHFRVPNYPVPERAMAAMAAMAYHRRWRERPPLDIQEFAVDRQRVSEILGHVRAEGRVACGDIEGREILKAYGIPTPLTYLARTADEAVAHAAKIGYPVAIKIASPDILHKTDVEGVRLNVSSPDAVRDAFDLMIYRTSRMRPAAEILGCLVQEMIPNGRELIIGMNRDAHFGPVMMFGLGGIYVETLRDVAFRLAPFDARDAREMISSIRSYTYLRGVRGEPPSDLEAVVDALQRLSQLAVDFPEIMEFDINPLTVFESGRGLTGIDMRLVLG